MEIYDFIKTVDVRNRANEMALRYAASILEDFRRLTPVGRSLMADSLMELISNKKKKSDTKTSKSKKGKP